MNTINAPFQEAILNQPEAIRYFYADLQSLHVSLKADMMSQLGLIVIFSDCNGDESTI